MYPQLKLVFDTNIYIMAVGMPSGYIEYWLDLATPPGNKFKLYTSPAILAEVQEKLESKLQFDRRLAVEYINRVKDIATTVNPTQKLEVIKDDPDDNIILECAVEAKADILISADKDLLKLKTYESIQIQHPTNLKYIFQYLAHSE
ncbi:MAG TPA: putative toxin-antitoxin system toxin component, PIN family [Candidatus Saccharimonadales bacterium]|nr:putative toxin-antitoxin system toxin component, PIN family [Candidatus Saccharimonadales bacterium]